MGTETYKAEGKVPDSHSQGCLTNEVLTNQWATYDQMDFRININQ